MEWSRPARGKYRQNALRSASRPLRRAGRAGAGLLLALLLLSGGLGCANSPARTTVVKQRVVTAPFARRAVQRKVVVVLPRADCVGKGRRWACSAR